MASSDERRDPIEEVAEACHAPIRTAWGDVQERFWEALLARIGSGLEVHRKAFGDAGLEGDLPDDWEPAADALLEYRKVVSTALLEPLRDALSNGGPSRVIADEMSAALDEAWDAASALPASVPSTWRSTALDIRPTDRLSRRVAKRIGRVMSAARVAGRDRDAPVRAVALRHVAEVVGPQEDREVARLLRATAEWSKQLDLVTVRWIDEALPALAGFEAPDDDDLDARWVAVRDSAVELQDGLEALLAAGPFLDIEQETEHRLAEWKDHLDADLSVAGSFVIRTRDGISKPLLKRTAKTAPAVDSWHDGVAARLTLGISLLALLSGVTAVHRRLSHRLRQQCVTPTEALPPVAEALDALSRQVGIVTRERLEELRSEVAELLKPAVTAVPSAEDVGHAVEGGADATLDALQAMVRQVPAKVDVHAESAKPPSGTRAVETRPIPVRELARQSFDAMRVERIRSSTSGLVSAVGEVSEKVEGLPDVFTFADEAAAQEWEGGEENAGARATELVNDALRSMAESLRHAVTDVEAAVKSAQTRLAHEMAEGSVALLDRLAAGRMQGQLLAAQSRFADLRAELNERWGPPVDRAARIVMHWGRKLQRLATRGLRRGSAIVGKGEAETTVSTRSVRALAEPAPVIEALPLVYQRLFTLGPLPDAALLVGRDTERETITERWRSWRTGDGVPVIIKGRPGSGITSLVNAVCSEIEADGGSVLRMALSDRVIDEERLALTLAEGLGLPATDTLAGLADAIFEADEDATPEVVALDDLEHLFLRVPGGTDQIERLLTLMAETEPRIFWIGGITTSAWQVVETGEPTAVSQVDVISLRPLAASAIREAIQRRHKRSGLAIRYQEPGQSRRLLRRRLRRVRDPEAYDDLVEADYFDQLYRAAAGDVRLALYKWMESADFSSGDGVVMNHPEKPSFSLLDALDLTQNFTLKAFLEHRSLTLGEHDTVFRLSTQESYQIFESLGNRHLIAVVDRAELSGLERSEVQANLRYRIQPLLMGAVISHLESRNIVH